tara:strand:+ start:231 stop:437 length:207 start_codon:yes stop_codon:yes gene_type:complete
MRNYFKQFTGKVQYNDPKPNEISFELEEDAELTDEIEKSLLEIKDAWNIPEDEIDAAIKSRKLSKKKN